MRRPRKGEEVCHCDAYRFPHRFSGGRCVGISVLEEAWADGAATECRDCHLFNEAGWYCEGLVGQEKPELGNCWQEYIRWHEIKLYGAKYERRR